MMTALGRKQRRCCRLASRLPAVAALAAVHGAASAAPMGYSGSTMAMTDLNPNWREAIVNHALTARDAIGIGYTLMRADRAPIQRELYELNYTRLIKRWNMPAAQLNTWFIGGIGMLNSDLAKSRVMASPGLQVDYETTRVYFSALARLYRAGDIKHDYGAVRAGASFFETQYDHTQPWLIIEARRMRGLSERIEWTPMLRLVNRRFFVEAGLSNRQEFRLNLMYIF